MPEGDTIFRAASHLRPVLQGRRIEAARCRDTLLDGGSLAGRTVTAVEPRGKHLLVHLDNGFAVHTHLGMHGSWHVYRPGQVWYKPESRAGLVLETAENICVCFNPKALELLSPDRLRRHSMLRRLGPDLLADSFDEAAVLGRFRIHDATPIGEAVMNQTIVCGIGNVYKSEILFLTKTNPFLVVRGLSDKEILTVVQQARQWMRRNLGTSRRQTRFAVDGGRMWVYARCGKPCFRCGQTIRVTRQGSLGRTTYWCPVCQPADPASGAGSP